MPLVDDPEPEEYGWEKPFGDNEDDRFAAEARILETGDWVLTDTSDGPGDIMPIGGRLSFSSSASAAKWIVPLTKPGRMFGGGRKMELPACTVSSIATDRGVGGGSLRKLRSEGIMPASGGELIKAATCALVSGLGPPNVSRSGRYGCDIRAKTLVGGEDMIGGEVSIRRDVVFL